MNGIRFASVDAAERNAVRLNVDAGKIARPLDTREGGLWTNAYNTGR